MISHFESRMVGCSRVFSFYLQLSDKYYMRLDIKNNSTHTDAPITEMYNAIGVQILHLCNRWPGAHNVVNDLNDSGYYLSLVDDLPEAEGALGYHDIDSEGRPYAKIAVNMSLNNGSDWLTGTYSVASVVGHEALETICNPIINIWRDVDENKETAQEACDAVEDTQYKHNGIDLTNFLLPSWFNPFGKAPYDYLGALSAPFSMTKGGYMIIREGGKTSAVYGETAPAWRKLAHQRAKTLGV